MGPVLAACARMPPSLRCRALCDLVDAAPAGPRGSGGGARPVAAAALLELGASAEAGRAVSRRVAAAVAGRAAAWERAWAPAAGDAARLWLGEARVRMVAAGAPAGPAAEAVGRDFVAVVIDGDLRPVGTLMGTADAKEIAAGIPVGDVMGPTPTSVEGETATVGDVAVICAAAALDEPVAVVDAAGRLTRVVRREDLLRNPRETRNEGLGVQGGGESAR